MPKTFKMQLPVRFADCDPAGIGFFPRLFEMVNAVVEDWLAQAVGVSFAQLHIKREEGLPTLAIECRFLSPARLGDILEFQLKVLKLGNSSFTLGIEAFNQGLPVLTTSNILVYSKLADGHKSMPIPTAVRERMLEYLHE